MPIARACALIRPPAIVAKHDNTHVRKASFPLRSDSDLGFHCEGAVAEIFSERPRVVARASSRGGTGIHEFTADFISARMRKTEGGDRRNRASPLIGLIFNYTRV